MVHDMYLMQLKTPAESKGSWDVYARPNPFRLSASIRSYKQLDSLHGMLELSRG